MPPKGRPTKAAAKSSDDPPSTPTKARKAKTIVGDSSSDFAKNLLQNKALKIQKKPAAADLSGSPLPVKRRIPMTPKTLKMAKGVLKKKPAAAAAAPKKNAKAVKKKAAKKKAGPKKARAKKDESEDEEESGDEDESEDDEEGEEEDEQEEEKKDVGSPKPKPAKKGAKGAFMPMTDEPQSCFDEKEFEKKMPEIKGKKRNKTEALMDAVHRLIASIPYKAAPAVGVCLHPCALTTFDLQGYPSTRTVVPYYTADDFSEIRISTKLNTRKEAEIQKNKKVSLHYHDQRGKQGWVTFKGLAKLVPSAQEDCADIVIKPERFECVSYNEAVSADDDGWKPAIMQRQGDHWRRTH